MQEHRREHRVEVIKLRDLGRNGPVLKEELIELAGWQDQFVEENEHTKTNERPVDVRFERGAGVFIPDGDHGPSPFPSSTGRGPSSTGLGSGGTVHRRAADDLAYALRHL